MPTDTPQPEATQLATATDDLFSEPALPTPLPTDTDVPTLEQQIQTAPPEDTFAQFLMHPGMDGKHNYAVHLITNDPSQPDKVVNVISNWVQ